MMDENVNTNTNINEAPIDEKIEEVDKGLSIFERLVVFFKHYSVWEILKTLILSVLIGYTIYLSLNPEVVFNAYEKWRKDEHTEAIENSMKNSVLIQNELETLRERVGASRVLLLSYHNTTSSLVGVPYIFLTAEAESIGSNIHPVAEGYERVKTSLYPFVNYLNRETYFSGDIEDLREIDKSLAYRMEGNDVQHFAAMNIEGEQPLGVLFITYTSDVDEKHNCSCVKDMVLRSAGRLAIYLSK